MKPAQVEVRKETTFRIEGPLTTGHLVQIIDVCRSYDPSTRVDIVQRRDQRDQVESLTVTVHGA